MRNVLLIAQRDYLEQIRGQAFKFSTVLLPLLLIAAMGAGYLTGRNIGSGKHLAIAADDPILADYVRSQLLSDKDTKLTVDVIAPATQEDRVTLMKQIQAKAIDGLLSIRSSSSDTPIVTYASQSSGDLTHTARLKNAFNRGLINERLTAAGMKQDQTDDLLKDVSIETILVNKEGKSEKSHGMAPYYKAMIMAIFLATPILLYGMDTARSIIEEKSSRIFEVMLSVARPDDLLTGKLIGAGAVGLTQIAIWVLAAGLLTGSTFVTSMLTGDFAIHFSWVEVVLFPVYFVLGFLLYSALFSGLAATCETSQDLQMYMPLAMVPTWISFGILPLLLNNPDSGWAVAASLFPPTAPFVMIPRLGLQMAPLWQIMLSIALLILSICVGVWLSSRLYRVGILMYGKRANLPELLRWLRYS